MSHFHDPEIRVEKSILPHSTNVTVEFENYYAIINGSCISIELDLSQAIDLRDALNERIQAVEQAVQS